MKVCARCGKEKDETLYFFNRGSGKRKSQCIKCKLEVRALTAAKNNAGYYARYRNAHKKEHQEYRAKHPMERWAYATCTGHKVRHLYPLVLESARRVSRCPICQCKLKYGYNGVHGGTMDTASLDRIYNDDRKDANAFWIICRRCNATKYDLTMNQFVP